MRFHLRHHHLAVFCPKDLRHTLIAVFRLGVQVDHHLFEVFYGLVKAKQMHELVPILLASAFVVGVIIGFDFAVHGVID